MPRYSYYGTAKDQNGKVIVSTTVSVYLAGTDTVASVYTASSGGVAVNSVTSGASTSSTPGYFIFWIDRTDYSFSQRFKIKISKSGFQTQEYDYISIFSTSELFPIINASEYASINAAVTAIGATETILLVSNAQTLAANLTIPSTLSLKIIKGGSIVKASTYTLTINGPFDAGSYQVFSGFSSGNVTFGAGAVQIVNSRWWGGNWNGTDSDTTPIECATATGIEKIWLPKNTLWIPTSDTVTGGLHYIGEDWEGVVIKSSNTTTAYITIPAKTILENVSFFDKWGVDQGLSPNIARPCRYFANNRGTNSVTASSWTKHGITLIEGESGDDSPGLSILQYGLGDAIYLEGNSGCVILRMVPNHVDSGMIEIDDIYQITTNPMIAYTTNKREDGNILSLYHSVSTFNGNAILLNFANNGGTFGANGAFLNCQINGVSKFWIDYSGDLNFASGGAVNIGGNQIITNRVVDARIDDTINSGDVTTDGVIDALRDAMIAHGLIAAA